MKKSTKLISVAVPFITAFSSCFFMAGTDPKSGPAQKDEVILQMMVGILSQGHFSPAQIDDEFSHRAYNMYIERLDYQKKQLLQSDVDELKKYYNQIDDQVLNSDFSFFEKSYTIINQRIKEAQGYYRDALAKPFDFTVKESVEMDPEKTAFPKNKAEMKESWRKYMKYQVMVRYVDLKKEQDKAVADQKADIVVKTDKELEADARKKVLKIQDEAFERLMKVKREDRVAMYLNVITAVYDPHTEFFPPKDKANFDINMSGQLEGIGAQLQEKEGYIKITNIIPGSPSWKDGRLKAGDAILKVGQGSADPVDVVGMDIDDAIKMIRGKKGTEVRLTVKKADGSTQIVTLIRDVVVLEETFAQSAIVEQGGKKYGYIKLPSFYADFGGSGGGHRCADDMKAELEKLKAEGVAGIMIDLRDNGGGSLPQVVKMAGLFIEDGPIVYQRNRGDDVETLSDRDKSITYSGPLAILVNENSASASEILAAAIQDYKRGIIVGSKSSFGKGTVQTFVELDNMATPEYASLKPLGSLKLTISKFYRANGGSTQLKGVIPDVILPDIFSGIETGEKDMDYPLKWDEIQPKVYRTWDNAPDVAAIKKNSDARISGNDVFKLISERADQLTADKNNTIESLLLTDYMADLKKREADKEKYKPMEQEVKNMTISSLKVDQEQMASDTSKMARKKAWLDRVKKDVYVDEVASMLKEMK